MTRLNVDQATELAREKIDQLALIAGDQFELLPNETKEIEQGWIFFFNSVDFVRTRDPMYALAGNAPIFITRGGVVHELTSANPWENEVKRILKKLQNR